MQSEPIVDLAHLGHVELLTPKPDESLRFFVEVLGMTETARRKAPIAPTESFMAWNARPRLFEATACSGFNSSVRR